MTGYAMQRQQLQSSLNQQQQQSLRMGGSNTSNAIAATTDKLLLSLAPSSGSGGGGVGVGNGVTASRPSTSHGLNRVNSGVMTMSTNKAVVAVPNQQQQPQQGGGGGGIYSYAAAGSFTNGSSNGRSGSANRTLASRYSGSGVGAADTPQAIALRSVQESTNGVGGGLASTHHKSANNVLSLSNAKITVTSSHDFERQPRVTSSHRLGSAHNRVNGSSGGVISNGNSGAAAATATTASKLRESVDLSPYQTHSGLSVNRPRTAAGVSGGRMARL